MAGFTTESDNKKRRELAIRQFFKTDPRFVNFSPAEVAETYRNPDLTKARLDFVHRPIEYEKLFEQQQELTKRVFYGEEDADGFEVTNGFWCVRIASYRRVYKNKVARTPEWEIQLKVGTATWMVFAAVIRERIVRHHSETVYEAWKKEVLGTEGKLKEALTCACDSLKETMAASWITSKSSERLLQRMGIEAKSEWGFLFKGQVFG